MVSMSTSFLRGIRVLSERYSDTTRFLVFYVGRTEYPDLRKEEEYVFEIISLLGLGSFLHS